LTTSVIYPIFIPFDSGRPALQSQVKTLFSILAQLINKQIQNGSLGADDDIPTPLRLNRSFLEALLGTDETLVNEGKSNLDVHQTDEKWRTVAEFYQTGLKMCPPELETFLENTEQMESILSRIAPETLKKKSDEQLRHLLYSVFFPEGSNLIYPDNRKKEIVNLRAKRTVKLGHLNKNPITYPAKEILFTSNILITKPLSPDASLDEEVFRLLKTMADQPQEFWYDHPIPLGVPVEQNEALYGIRGLDDMLESEIKAGHMDQGEKLSCVLSVSTTHSGLQKLVKPYLEAEFKKIPTVRNIDLYLFTELQTRSIIQDILEPLTRRYFPDRSAHDLHHVFGVEGEYGRHYTFLKAISAMWQIFCNPDVRATFKIDLDQVFPQHELLAETGHTVFEHFMTPLWGATGTDAWKNPVDLSMIAGALVNESDISRSLFTPDVTFPGDDIPLDGNIFFSRLPQALSTEAEMMTRYEPQTGIDGITGALQRIHVTGGTNGILIEALRRYRPFTPTLFGRAEDQAYLFSVLLKGERFLRYVHKPGLVMRHDKQAFAQEAIKAAATGKQIGDYIRILLFSNYARILPWEFEDIKKHTDPFTGCFISRVPLCVVYLRFSLQALQLYASGQREKAADFIIKGAERLLKMITYLGRPNNPLSGLYHKEKDAWELFYDILDAFEEEKDPAAKSHFSKRFKDILSEGKIHFK
jgi:hypothetical protein